MIDYDKQIDTNCANKKSEARNAPAQFLYAPGRGRYTAIRWTFSCKFASLDELDSFRRGRGMYWQKIVGRIYFFCSTKKCPYKMLSIKNECHEWTVYERNEHNHSADDLSPIRKHIKRRQAQKNWSSSTNNSTQSSSIEEISEQRPRLLLKFRKSSDGFLLDRSTTSSTDFSDGVAIQKDEKLQAKLFESAECGRELEKIGKKWHLILKEKKGSFLFVPPRDSKPFKEGILMAFTDRGNHIRMDEFKALHLQSDKIRRWPKALGHATIMQLINEQCGRLFACTDHDQK
uniref:FLYWCH-type domain-containing protein n=1 Tax=Globodera pallida TaxID=36090 RepID=A0A183BKR7_GLOPA